jgi:hypothetical protein
VIAPRRLLCGAKQPPYRTRWTRGKGTKAASFSKSSTGERVIPVVPSDQGVVKRIHEIPVGILGKTLKHHCTAGRIADQAIQPVPPMGGDLSVGVQRKPMEPGTAGPVSVGLSPS